MTATDAAAMPSALSSEHQKSQNSGLSASCALWPVDLKLTHLDWNLEATLIHFQGQYLTICELDYNILQGEIQNVPKTRTAVDIGEFCLVEDVTSARWYRGRVQNRKEDLFDVFLIDHGNVLSVDITNISGCSNDLFNLPPKIVCGFLANALLLPGCSHSVVEEYFSNLIGKNVTGYIQALLPHKVFLLEAPDINDDLVRHGFGRHVDTNTFLLLVEMLTEVPLKQNVEQVPDLLIEKPRGLEYCFRPSGLQGYEDILSFCGPRLSCGMRTKVRVTAAVNPGLFYCQMASLETDLWEMSKKLAADCEYKTKGCNERTQDNLGLLCAVKGKDGKWHRGFVQFLPVNSQVRVLFIDYGFFESVKVENVHRLPPNFHSAPIMAFSCSLFCLSDQDEVVKTQQLHFLKAGLLGKVLDVEIRSFDEEQHCYSIKVIGAEDNHMTDPEPIHKVHKINGESVFETEQPSLQGGYLYYETIMSETLDKTLEAEEVQVGSVFVGHVEHVQNPQNFWIRTQKRNDDFEEMMMQMADHFSQVKLEEDVLVNPDLGTLCCAVYEEDMHFYRGVVTDTLEHGAEVLFIDFGNIEKVPSVLIKRIPEEFAKRSAFAFCCSLVNVFPFDDVWTGTTCGFFRRAVTNKALLVHVVQRRKNKFVVDLCEIGSDSNQSITELLVSAKQAEGWNNVIIEPVVKNNMEVTDKTKYPRCVTPDINGNTEQWTDCEEEEETCKHEIENSQSPARFKALTTEPGCEFAVRCSHISSPVDFWCQRLDKVPALEELMGKVQQYYSTHTVILQSEESCCVAKSPQDGRWYRAFITTKQKGHATVMLVDYGFTIQLKEHNLQGIIPEYVHLEGQAFRCSLYNLIEPVDPKNCGTWSPEVCHLLKDFVCKSTSGLRCKVVSQLKVKNKGLCNVVDLYDTQTQQSIINMLLEQGLAREVTTSGKHLSAVIPESFVFSSHSLSPGNQEQVFVTHVNSQCEFYCHLESNTEIIAELEKKISEESEKMRQASTRAVVNKLCLAKYWDGKWYRGVASPVQSPLHLSVFFVDYGNTGISEKTQVMFIPRDSADLLYTPMQAIRCTLASVCKEEPFAGVKEWLDDAVLNKQVRVHIVGRNKDGSFDVQLFDGEVNINEKVKELIVSFTSKPERVVSFDMGNSKMKEKTQKRTGTIKTSVKNKSQQQGPPNSLSSKSHRRTHVGGTPLKKKDNKTTYIQCKAQRENSKVKQQNPSSKSYVPQKPQIKSQRKQQSQHHATNAKSEKPQYSEKAETPQLPCLRVTKGFRTQCFVSHIDSVNSFFVQLSEDEPAILKLAEDLNSGNLRDSLKPAISLKISDLVLAEYEEDGCLYRSMVKGFERSSCFKVEFVDYGNSAVMGKEKMYTIPQEYLSQPRFSIPCSLLDTSMFQNDASFTDAVMEKPLMVDFVRRYGSQWEVKLAVCEEGAALEAASEDGSKPEKEEEASSSSVEERVRTSDQSYSRKEVSGNETAKSTIMTSAVYDENITLKAPSTTLNLPPANLKAPLTTVTPSLITLQSPPCILNPSSATSKLPHAILKSSASMVNPLPASLSRKLKVMSYKHHLMNPTRNKRDSKNNQGENVKNSVKVKSECAVTPPAVQAKDTEHCTVLSVQSNGSFYVRLNRTIDLLSALECHVDDSLHKYELVDEEDVKQGLKCLVQGHKDKKWQRAVVQHVRLQKCQVLLIDHGITEEIPSCSIRQQCSHLTKIPNLAVLCRVNCLGVSEEEDGSNLWFETLKPMIGSEVKLMFVSYSEAERLWKVEIMMNGLFLIHYIAASLQLNEKTASPPETQNQATEGKSTSDTSQPQQLIFAPVDLDKAYWGSAAAVTTPFEFCVFLEDSRLIMNKVSTILDDLPERMSPLPEAHLIPGSCCLFKSHTTNKWCRVEIVRIDTTVILNLVDHGHQECIPHENCSNLKRLPEEIMDLPKVTYHCMLRGVQPVRVDGQWTDEAAAFFQEWLYPKNFQIFFREFVSNTRWKVDVVADGIDIAKELVDAGHASYIDIMLKLRSQEQSLCKAPPDAEEECDQEDKASDDKSDVSVESTDEAEKTTPLTAVPGSAHCFLM